MVGVLCSNDISIILRVYVNFNFFTFPEIDNLRVEMVVEFELGMNFEVRI